MLKTAIGGIKALLNWEDIIVEWSLAYF